MGPLNMRTAFLPALAALLLGAAGLLSGCGLNSHSAGAEADQAPASDVRQAARVRQLNGQSDR
jgi:hypothetical protein